MINIERELEDYIVRHTEPEEEVLKELYRETHMKIYHPRMLSGHLQGKLLQLLCRMIQPERILEIGTYTGYSAISMAFASGDDCVIHTIEVNDELRDFSMSYIRRAGVENKIVLHTGDALEIIPGLNMEFDLVFIDGDKKEYPQYYELVIKKVRNGGFILADNALWGGKVIAKGLRENDYDARGIINFNDIVMNDNNVENILLPFRDGIMLIRKK
ncbi:MAG: O-methyltransferase [Bacteroidota bacterium]